MYQGDVVAANILGEPREANYDAVPRAVFSATVPIRDVPETAAYTRAYANSNGFLTLLSDGEPHRRLRARPGGGGVAAAGDVGDPRASRSTYCATPLSAALLGDQLDARREQLRTTLPVRRVVGPADIAALAVHLMTNTALTGATFDVDAGQQLVER
jgi:NAD(P)-dependent dehydrogenase (short-subunit alcohol dehydrogenase family)